MRKTLNAFAASGTVIGFAVFLTTLIWGLVAFWHPLPKALGWAGVFGGFVLMVTAPLLHRPDRVGQSRRRLFRKSGV